MASRSMKAVLDTLIQQVQDSEGLTSLLVNSEHEDQRPRLKINGKVYVLGLVDNKAMLVGEKDKEFLNPNLLPVSGDGFTEIVWKLK